MSFLSNLFGKKNTPKPIALSDNPNESDSLFLKFENSEARRAYGGSAFIELQYCRLDTNVISDCVNIDNLTHWQSDSLYVYFDNLDKFYKEYSSAFLEGLYNNSERGSIDLYGMNYFLKEQLPDIIARIEESRPTDYKTLLEWLKAAQDCNGIYILGI